MIDNFRGDHYFLSNFCPSPIWLGGREYKTVEHFYQAHKAENLILHEYVRNAETPEEAKKRGREVKKRADWEGVKLQIMGLGLVLKFDIVDLGDMLLGTGEEELVEGNTWNDTFWGVCDGIGENHLGEILMTVRDQVIERRCLQVSFTGEQNVE